MKNINPRFVYALPFLAIKNKTGCKIFHCTDFNIGLASQQPKYKYFLGPSVLYSPFSKKISNLSGLLIAVIIILAFTCTFFPIPLSSVVFLLLLHAETDPLMHGYQNQAFCVYHQTICPKLLLSSQKRYIYRLKYIIMYVHIIFMYIKMYFIALIMP